MRTIASLFVFVAFIFATSSVRSQEILPTPLQPVSVFVVGNNIHVLTAQKDFDFDGTQDDGEEPATWTTYDRDTYAKTLETSFAWKYVVAGRTGFHAVSGKLYVAVGDSVAIYSMTTHELLGILDEHPATAVTVSSDGQRIYLSRRPSFSEPGYVDQVTVGSGTPFPLDAGISPQISRTYRTSSGSVGVAIVCEGVFGQSNGTVELWAAGGTGYERTTINVGDSPNHIAISGDRAYVAVNGSNWISVIDLESKKVVDTIPVGTTGLNGPREIAVYNDVLYVTLYEGVVRLFDANTGARLADVACSSKPEALAIIDDKLFVTRSYQSGSYNAYSGVLIVSLDVISSVAELSNKIGRSTSLFAMSDFITLPLFEGSTSLQARSLDGKTYDVTIADAATMRVDLSSLPSGVYVITDGKASIVVGK